jgi:chromosome segregation ATPase
METQIEANNEKFEALRGTLLSRKDIHQASTEAIQEEMKAKMNKNQEKMDDWLEEMKAWRKKTTACQEATEACLEKAKAGREEMEAALGVFEERLDKMDVTDLEANREKSEGVAVRHEVHDEEAAMDTIGAPEDRSMDEEPDVGYRNPRKKRTKTMLYEEPLKDECWRQDYGYR